ncbi:MAG: amino acid ABC transporter permease [Candidatus Bipolaricaulota bacterium]|nr:amino acid ABC transporter permease [Candidatus Bipolaricaulota bacterium]MCS7273973.1 amino acid ABC transporter permease [Candidatus Bipolaricaulota bacterium]MDW8111326.1 amino acid ABC transporter permease [Candidatus Bipolaricaulota bacterium]MDW8329254.1 amino acid ABC transporter permease [Candidatus Bipolaricaulota bacterium]
MIEQKRVAAEVLPPPTLRYGPLRWLRENLFSTWYNTLLTLLCLWGLYAALSALLEWAFTRADWSVIPANLKLLLVGTYPAEMLWRVWAVLYFVVFLLGGSAGLWGSLLRDAVVALSAAFFLLALLPFGMSERLLLAGLALLGGGMMGAGWLLRRAARLQTWSKRILLGLWVLSPILVVVLVGGLPGSGWLPTVSTEKWGGLMLTFMLAIVGITTSFPLGVLLALGRRSELPVVRWFSILYIEIIRGVPLVTVIFMASVMLPLFLPGDTRVDQAVRAMTAFTLFTAAYIAENVRGGLQNIPRGQYEAAHALGLSHFWTTVFIVLPQALRAVIPANVGQFISLFKDTSLVFVAALLDLFNIGRSILANPTWLAHDSEMLLFIASVYFVFAYFMSRLSQRLERLLGVGER